MRSGVEIWDEATKIKNFQADLGPNMTAHFFAKFGEETVNTADVVGIFSPKTMADYTRRKNGLWKCGEGEWHEKNTKCDCASKDEKERTAEWGRRVSACGKCSNGMISKGETMAYCDCVRDMTVEAAKENWKPEPI